MTASFVGYILSGKQLPKFDEVYDVEEEENTDYIKANLMAWMYAVNRQRKVERECQK